MNKAKKQQGEADARKLLSVRSALQPEGFPLFRMILSAYMDGLQTGAQMNSAADTKKGA